MAVDLANGEEKDTIFSPSWAGIDKCREFIE